MENKRGSCFIRRLKAIDSSIAAFSRRLNIKGEKFLQSRIFLGGVALSISILIWAFVAWDGNTEGSRTFSAKIQYENLQRGYSYYDKSGGTVSVRLSGRINALSNIEQGDISARVDLQGLQVGKYSLPIKLDVPQYVRVRNWDPSTAEIEIYRYVERTLPITWKLDGDAPEGMIVASVDIKPAEVVLSGPEADVLAVQGVEAVVPAEKLSAAGGVKVPLSLSPAAEDEKNGGRLKVSPSTVSVSFSMEEEMVGERIPVNVSVVGQPAEGLEVDSIKVMPERVTVRGRSEAVRKMQALVLPPVDISGLDQDLELMLPLQPGGASDDGVEVTGPDRARVDIKLRKKMAVKTFHNVSVLVEGTNSQHPEWRVTPQSVTLTVEGAQAAIETLRGTAPCDLYVDVSNIVLQRIQLPVLIKDLKKDFQVVKIEPDQVIITAVE